MHLHLLPSVTPRRGDYSPAGNTCPDAAMPAPPRGAGIAGTQALFGTAGGRPAPGDLGDLAGGPVPELGVDVRTGSTLRAGLQVPQKRLLFPPAFHQPVEHGNQDQ